MQQHKEVVLTCVSRQEYLLEECVCVCVCVCVSTFEKAGVGITTSHFLHTCYIFRISTNVKSLPELCFWINTSTATWWI